MAGRSTSRARRLPNRLFGALALAGVAALAWSQPRPAGFADAVLGRWDLTVDGPNGPYPSWLEVRLRTESELMGRFVGVAGSVRHVTSIDYTDGRLEFMVPVQYERGPDPLTFEGMLERGALRGTTRGAGGDPLTWSGVRAPALRRQGEPIPGSPVALFNGRDLNGWTYRSDRQSACWTVEAGELVVKPPCVDLITTAAFNDFRLRVELKYPAGSNSGIYLRGRYEVQVQDTAGTALDPLRMGAIYGFIAPTHDAARPAGEWQTLEITLIGRSVTVVLNGQTVIDGQDIPGITGGALDSHEGDAGSIMLQGDHGPIRFREISLTPL